jgi:hypothetical protein
MMPRKLTRWCSISCGSAVEEAGERTQLYDERRAIRYEYAFSQDVAGLLFEAADGLYDWVAPDLPEDLHLLRGDGSAFLGSVAHERDAWLEAEQDEFARLAQSVPGLDQIVKV